MAATSTKSCCVPNLSEEAHNDNLIIDKILAAPDELKYISLDDMAKLTTEDWIAYFKATKLTYPEHTNRFNKRALPIISTDDLFKDAAINKTYPVPLPDGVYYNSPYAPSVTIKDNRITRVEIYMTDDTVRPSIIWHFDYSDTAVKSYREFTASGSKFEWKGPSEPIKKMWDENTTA
jgi:hypothetical protein